MYHSTGGVGIIGSALGKTTRISEPTTTVENEVLRTTLKGIVKKIKISPESLMFFEGNANNGAVSIGESKDNPIFTANVIASKIIIKAHGFLSESKDVHEALKQLGYTLGNDGWERPLFTRSVIRQ
jgi:hypothetical protein